MGSRVVIIRGFVLEAHGRFKGSPRRHRRVIVPANRRAGATTYAAAFPSSGTPSDAIAQVLLHNRDGLRVRPLPLLDQVIVHRTLLPGMALVQYAAR